jgi:hypothetical protein
MLVLPFDVIKGAEGCEEFAEPMIWAALSPRKLTATIEYTIDSGSGKQRYSASADVEVTRRDSSALVAVMLVAGLLLLGGLLVRRRTKADAKPDAKTKRVGLLDACLELITTPLGTYSLSMAQVLLWTAITLFGYTFLWLLTNGTPTIPTQVLGLLGIGTGAAMLSRLANGEKQSLPLRYLALVPRTAQPAWSDLVNLDGRPSLFKFQMLGFTVVTSLVVLRELYVGGRFVEISDSLILLMGLSSGTYVGNEALQSKPWTRVRLQIEKIEELANGLKVPVGSREALVTLLAEAKAALNPTNTPPTISASDRAELYQALRTLEEMLIELYSDRPLSELLEADAQRKPLAPPLQPGPILPPRTSSG